VTERRRGGVTVGRRRGEENVDECTILHFYYLKGRERERKKRRGVVSYSL